MKLEDACEHLKSVREGANITVFYHEKERSNSRLRVRESEHKMNVVCIETTIPVSRFVLS